MREGWLVDIVVPERWRHEYSSTAFEPSVLPGLVGSFRPLPVAFAGRPQRHVYRVNPRTVIRSARPDVIFLEQESFSMAAIQWAAAAVSLRIPFGVQAAENIDRSFPAAIRALRSWVLGHASFVAARSPAASQLATCWGASGEVDLIPHHVPSWACRGQRKPGVFRVGFAGRLVPEKGLDVLVEAVRRLERPVELVIVGDGPLRRWLVEQYLGRSTLRFIDGIPHGDMDQAYAEMDVLVLPSRTTRDWTEQFGRVLVEALWCGVPVIGSDTGEISWVIETTKGGQTFPDGDCVALAALLDSFRDDELTYQQFAINGRRCVNEVFSVEAVASKLGPLLERAAETPRSGLPRGTADGRPRVALVAHGIHDRAGMEHACAQLIRHLHNEVRFLVVCAELAPDLEPLVEDWCRVRVPSRPIPLKFVLFFAIAGRSTHLARVDLIHTVGALIPNRADVVAVHFCHAGALRSLGSVVPKGPPWIRRVNTGLARSLGLMAERWAFRPNRVKMLAPVSIGVAAELASCYPDVPATVVPNGVDGQRFRPDVDVRRSKRNEEGVGNDELIVLFIGGDWDHKGLTIAIEALTLARSLAGPMWLWVVGAGDQVRFRRVAEEAGVAAFIRFFGPSSDPERYYQAADIFVLPSRYETFSLVSYEAASCALPIVATAVSGITELIGNNEGGVVVTRDSSVVGGAIAQLSLDPERRKALGAVARERAIAFDWQESAAKVLGLYRSLLDTSIAEHDAT